MKKLISLLFLFVHLFNIGGQLLFHECLVYKSNKFFEQQISKNRYNINDLTEIRIPENLPGVTNQQHYENLSGRIQFGNTAYNYVKIKMTRKAIYLVCIPNYATTRLCRQNIIDARQIPDIPVQKKEHVPYGKINLQSYSAYIINYSFSNPLVGMWQPGSTIQSLMLHYFITSIGQPPDKKISSL